MELKKLIERLKLYDPDYSYTVRIESESLIITKVTDVDEIEVNKED